MNAQHILLLLKIKLNIILNSFFKSPGKKRHRKLIAIAAGGFLFVFIYKWIYEIFSVLHHYPAELIDNFMAMTFLGFFIFLIVTGITVSIHYLFVSSDLPLLMTSPVSENTIFTFKLIEAIFANSTFFYFMGLPIFIVYGVVMQASWYYYPFMLLNSLVFLAIPVSLSFLGALVLIRIIPPVRAREIMSIFLGIVSLGIWLILQIVRASSFNQNSQDFNPRNINALQQVSDSPIINLLPSTFAAQALKGFAHFDIQLIALRFLPLIALMIGIWILCTRLMKYAFREGFISSEQSLTVRRKKRLRSKAISDSNSARSRSPKTFGVIFTRDVKLVTRDTRQLINIFMFAVIMVILPLLQKSEPADAEFSRYLPYIFLIIFAALIAGQISSRLIPIEGKSFWITKLSPQPSSRILFEKFFLGFSASTMIAWMAVIIVGIFFQHPIRLIGLAIVAAMSFSGMLSAIGLLLATYFARFDWDHPKRMLSSTGGVLLFFSSIFIVAVIGGITVLIYFFGEKLGFTVQSLDIFAGIFLIFTASLVIFVAIILGGKKLDKMEWLF